MPIYVFWGDDDYSLAQTVAQLRDRAVAAPWRDFNEGIHTGGKPDQIVAALNDALTPPFGSGDRYVEVRQATLCQQCPPELLTELTQTLPAIPPTTVLAIICARKPDGRLKSTKLLKKYAEVREFALIPPWKTDELLQQARQLARQYDVPLTPAALELLSAAVGNNIRQLHSELAKLALYSQSTQRAIDPEAVNLLVRATTQTSLKLAEALRDREVAMALATITSLLDRNEPPLRVVATLVGQFRTWLAVKLAIANGIESDRELAAAAEIANPKRLYFLRQQLRHCSGQQLANALPVLLSLELALKRGAEPRMALQNAAVVLCQL